MRQMEVYVKMKGQATDDPDIKFLSRWDVIDLGYVKMLQDLSRNEEEDWSLVF